LFGVECGPIGLQPRVIGFQLPAEVVDFGPGAFDFLPEFVEGRSLC
jgi:hypothetical protein